MENAEVISFDRKKLYGFARVMIFKSDGGMISKSEEIIFHLGCGYKMRMGKCRPKFNYKTKIKKFPRVGEHIVFARKKSENGNPRHKAALWGLRTQYKEIWEAIDKRNGQQQKLLKINQVFQKIERERNQETRKAF